MAKAYAPSEDRKGRSLRPGDRVRLRIYPKGSIEGVVTVHPRLLERMPDRTYLPALAVQTEDGLFRMPGPRGVLKLSPSRSR